MHLSEVNPIPKTLWAVLKIRQHSFIILKRETFMSNKQKRLLSRRKRILSSVLKRLSKINWPRRRKTSKMIDVTSVAKQTAWYLRYTRVRWFARTVASWHNQAWSIRQMKNVFSRLILLVQISHPIVFRLEVILSCHSKRPLSSVETIRKLKLCRITPWTSLTELSAT